MAETVHLFLKANGSQVKGDSSQTSAGRENSIECLFFDFNVLTAREAGSGMATGRRQYQPILIRKRVDKATPLLFKALTNNEKIQGVFKFYRPNQAGDGTTEQFFTIEIEDGRVSSQKLVNPDTIVPASSTQPPMEEITFHFASITQTIENGGITHQDTWSAGGKHG
jgi:type VI secretion system secreted protein Hcp